MASGFAWTSSNPSSSYSVYANSPKAMIDSPRIKYVPNLWIATPFYQEYTRSSASLIMQFSAWSNPLRTPTNTLPSLVTNLARLPRTA